MGCELAEQRPRLLVISNNTKQNAAASNPSTSPLTQVPVLVLRGLFSPPFSALLVPQHPSSHSIFIISRLQPAAQSQTSSTSTKPSQQTVSDKWPEPSLRTGSEKRSDWGFSEYMEEDHSDLPLGESSDGRRQSLEFVIEPDKKQPVIWESNSSRTNKIKGGEGSGPYAIAERITHGRERKVVIHGDMIKSKVKLTDLMPIGSKESKTGLSSIAAWVVCYFLLWNTELTPTRVGHESDALVTQSEDELDEEEMPTPKPANGGTLPPTPKQASGCTVPDSWYDNYKTMKNKGKWVLASGRCVENVILKACEKMGSKAFASSPARLFILDTSDPLVEGWFSNDEWKEITSKLSPLPEADETLADSFKAFYCVRTTTMLREILKSGLIPGDVTYDKNLHFNLQWAEMVLLKFLILFEAPDNPLIQQHNEGWYVFNIWSQILDTGVLDLQGLALERGENTCQATSLCRNHQRDDPMGRVKLGHRLDGIIRTLVGGHHEFGGIEDGATFKGGVVATKWKSDQSKLIKCMRDMFKPLDDLVNSDPTIKRRMQIVGISTAGLALQYTLLGHRGHGHVYLLQKGKVVQVPTTVGELPDLLRILVMVAQLKQLVKVSFEAVNERDHVLSGRAFIRSWLADLRPDALFIPICTNPDPRSTYWYSSQSYTRVLANWSQQTDEDETRAQPTIQSNVSGGVDCLEVSK
ncbi:hypothetical protein HOY82DRAFT_631252 [Tuber indicum]|nr:hypothetical protein HOY82DRAFT_631252 [Tuber indicum]